MHSVCYARTRPNAVAITGGHGVERNDSLAYDYYLEAHDMGHWRAPYALAVSHQAGLGVPANCSTAWHYFQIFIKERSSWTEQMELALLAVDAGMHFVKSFALILMFCILLYSKLPNQCA